MVTVSVPLYKCRVPSTCSTFQRCRQKIDVVFEPAEAKPGQTVTLKINIVLTDGYHTYPVTQPAEEARFSANKITFPTTGSILYVGETVDPVLPKTKKEQDYELLYYPGGGTWLRKAVVLPNAKPGTSVSKVSIKLLICDKDNCFPPKTFDTEATLKILDAPAVTVEPRYAAAVEKALKK